MLGFAITLLTPRAGFLAALAVVPVAAFAIAAARVEGVRRVLRLAPPARRSGLGRAALLAAVVLLLVLAATQPAVRTQASVRARTDAAAFVVLDTSRSMLAAPSAGAPTRLRRAKEAALALGARLPGIPLGVATFTDRVLPDLFPTADHGAFDSTVEAVTAEAPPPREVDTVATTFDALSTLATDGFFSPDARRRAVVVFTDGESRAFDAAGLADTFAAHGIRLAVVQVGSGSDRIRRSDGTIEGAYRPDSALARESITRLRSATGGGTDPVAVVRGALGAGPTRVIGVEPRSRSLAPFAALLALVPLAAVIGLPRRWLRGVTSSRDQARVEGVRA
jgi:von Willebrand factor type A domain